MTIRTRAGAALVALAFMAPLPALATKPKPTIDLGTPDGAMAAWASLPDISTNPKPRGLPVSRSLISFTESTLPWRSNNARTSSSVALNGRLPT